MCGYTSKSKSLRAFNDSSSSSVRGCSIISLAASALKPPVLAEVLGDVPFLAGAERPEGPPEEYQGPAELLLVQGFDVPRELLPERLPRQ